MGLDSKEPCLYRPPRGFYWVAVKELRLSCSNKATLYVLHTQIMVGSLTATQFRVQGWFDLSHCVTLTQGLVGRAASPAESRGPESSSITTAKKALGFGI